MRLSTAAGLRAAMIRSQAVSKTEPPALGRCANFDPHPVMRDTYAPQASVAYCLPRPDVRLTKMQVEHRWGLDGLMCDALLAALVDARKGNRLGVQRRLYRCVPFSTRRG